MVTNTAGLASLSSLWLYAAGQALSRHRTFLNWLANLELLICFACLSATMALRTFNAQRLSFSNMYESLILLAWAILAVYLLLSRKYKGANLGTLSALSVSSVFLYLSWLPQGQREIAPLMPALVSNWRLVHVPPLVISYALLIVGGLSAVMHLFKIGRWATGIWAIAALLVSLSAYALALNTDIGTTYIQGFFWTGNLLTLSLALLSLKAPQAALSEENKTKSWLYDEVSQRCITVAFPLLTFGIITGALWANHAWGTYWSWDPKETMSLITWCSYAIYLHVRARAAGSSAFISLLAVFSLLLTLLTYLGFTAIGFGGLHAYGRV
jgi:cytochrome c-type biogenesis protein CcsB